MRSLTLLRRQVVRGLSFLAVLAVSWAAHAEDTVPPRGLTDALQANPGETRTLLPDGRVLILGGARATRQVRLFDPVSQQLQALAVGLQHGRREHAATLLPDGQVLITGGRNAAGVVVATAERLDPRTGVSQSATELGLVLRAGHTTRMLPDATMLIAGGVGPDGRTIAQAEILDPKVARVQSGGQSGLLERTGAALTLLADGNALLAGGRDTRGVAAPGGALYRPAARTWEAVPAGRLSALLAPATGTEPPQVLASQPRADEQGFDPNAPIVVRFSRPVDPRSVRQDTVAIVGAGGAVKAMVTPSDDGLLAFVTPFVPLAPGSRYSIVVRGVLSVIQSSVPLATVAFSTRDVGAVSAEAVARARAAGVGAGGASASSAAPGAAILDQPIALQVAPQAEDDDESFVPKVRNFGGRWRSDRALPREIEKRINDALSLSGGAAYQNENREYRSALRLRMRTSALPAASTGLAGQVLRLNDRPLANALVTVAGRRLRTDADGRFQALGLAPGHYDIFVDGSNTGTGRTYGQFVVGADVEAGEVTEIAPVFVPRIRDTDWVDIPNPVRQDLVVTHPAVPGMEIHIPKGAILRERDGKLVTRLALVPMPLERAPMPFPDNAPVFVSVQPGGIAVSGLDPAVSRGIRVIYPNATNEAPGAKARFWRYDPAGKGWYVYGWGQVTADARQVAPDPGVELHDAIGFMFVNSQGEAPPAVAPPNAPDCTNGGNPPDKPSCATEANSKKGKDAPTGRCPNAADPVDCATGLMVTTNVDMTVQDVVPLHITRVYRPGDSASRAFGIGASHPYGAYLWFQQNSFGGANDLWVKVVMANGATHHFDRSGNIYVYSGTSADLKGATLASNARGIANSPTGHFNWVLRRRDGTKLWFSGYIAGYPMVAMDDRHGNRTQFVITSGNLTRIVSPSGRYIDLSYDASRRITQATDHTSRTVTYNYTSACTANGNSPQGYLCRVTDPANFSENYSYDSLGRITQIVDKRNNTVMTNTYDAQGRVSTQTDAGGDVTQFTYTPSGAGPITQTDVTDPLGRVTRMTFNASGQMTSRTEALGTPRARTTTYEYAATSMLSSAEVDPLGRRTEYSYDSFGNLTQVRYMVGTPEQHSESFTYRTSGLHEMLTGTDTRGKVTSFAYDLRGRLTQVTDPLNNVTRFEYNGAGLVTRVIDPRNQATVFTYDLYDLSRVTDPLNRSTSFFTDALGRVLQVTNPLGQRSVTTYDSLHRVKTSTDPAGNQVQMNYDANGNMTSFTDPRGGVTGFAYNAKNLLITRTDPLLRPESFTYDDNDNLFTHTDRKGQITTHGYDELNRRTLTTWHGGATTAYTFDAGDRLTQITDSVSGTVTRTYDNRFDAVATETVPLGAGTSTITYSYDVAARRTQMQVTGQTAVTYGYDDANRLTSVTQGANAVSFTYDVASRRTKATLPNLVTIDYAYNNGNELTTLTYKRNTTTTLGTLGYTYDAAGRRLTMTGNLARVALPPALASATYNAANRLTVWAGTNLTYDFNGNLTNDGVQTYTWDVRDRLTGVSGGTATASFVYDPLTRRASKTINAVQSGTLYDGFSEVHTTAGAAVTSTLLNGPGLDERYARTSGSTTTVILPDALGSTVNLIGPTGTTTATYTYEPYGVSTPTGTDTLPYRYTGREDDGMGLMYYRARYYHPRFGRFVSEDPIGLAGGYNLYGYVGGSPTNGVDPLGLYTLNLFSWLFEPNGTLYAAASKVDPGPQYLWVSVHATPTGGVGQYTWRGYKDRGDAWLVQKIRESGSWKPGLPVIVGGCRPPPSTCEYVAKQLGVPVACSDKWVWYWSKGRAESYDKVDPKANPGAPDMSKPGHWTWYR